MAMGASARGDCSWDWLTAGSRDTDGARSEVSFGSSWRFVIFAGSLLADGHTGAEECPDREANHQDDGDEDETHRPRLLVPVIIRPGGVNVDSPRKGVHGGVDVGAIELVAESGEEERGGFAADAGEAEHDAGDDAGEG